MFARTWQSGRRPPIWRNRIYFCRRRPPVRMSLIRGLIANGSDYDLNLSFSKALGLTISRELLFRADKVIDWRQDMLGKRPLQPWQASEGLARP
jgi:hypothetical protein